MNAADLIAALPIGNIDVPRDSPAKKGEIAAVGRGDAEGPHAASPHIREDSHATISEDVKHRATVCSGGSDEPGLAISGPIDHTRRLKPATLT